MIPKREILDLATQTNLQPHVVEKDYDVFMFIDELLHYRY